VITKENTTMHNVDEQSKTIILYITQVREYKKVLIIKAIQFALLGITCFIISKLDNNIYSSIVFFIFFLIWISLFIMIFTGTLFIKPIIIQRNGIYFPFITQYNNQLFNYPTEKFLDWASIIDIKRKNGILILSTNGKQYLIPNKIEELDEIERLIRNNLVASDLS
jgi:hypothetical protein